MKKEKPPLHHCFFLEEELPYLFLWQEAEAGGVSTCTAQPPLTHAWSAHLTSLRSKSFQIIYDSEWKEKKNQSIGQDSKDRLGTQGGDSHCAPTVNLPERPQKSSHLSQKEQPVPKASSTPHPSAIREDDKSSANSKMAEVLQPHGHLCQAVLGARAVTVCQVRSQTPTQTPACCARLIKQFSPHHSPSLCTLSTHLP